MSKCQKCKDTGFIEEVFIKNARSYNQVKLCPDCKNLEGYGKEIKKRFGNQEETPQQKVNRLLGRE